MLRFIDTGLRSLVSAQRMDLTNRTEGFVVSDLDISDSAEDRGMFSGAGRSWLVVGLGMQFWITEGDVIEELFTHVLSIVLD